MLDVISCRADDWSPWAAGGTPSGARLRQSALAADVNDWIEEDEAPTAGVGGIGTGPGIGAIGGAPPLVFGTLRPVVGVGGGGEEPPISNGSNGEDPSGDYGERQDDGRPS